jgi:hypothetical protein
MITISISILISNSNSTSTSTRTWSKWSEQALTCYRSLIKHYTNLEIHPNKLRTSCKQVQTTRIPNTFDIPRHSLRYIPRVTRVHLNIIRAIRTSSIHSPSFRTHLNNSDRVRTKFELYSHASAAVSSSSDTRTVPWNVPASCDKLISSRTMTRIAY